MTFVLNILGQCIAPLGMESGSIKDSAISASSSFEDSTVGAHNARYVNKNLSLIFELRIWDERERKRMNSRVCLRIV